MMRDVTTNSALSAGWRRAFFCAGRSPRRHSAVLSWSYWRRMGSRARPIVSSKCCVRGRCAGASMENERHANRRPHMSLSNETCFAAMRGAG